MENTKNIGIAVVMLGIGFVGGYFFTNNRVVVPPGTHVMPNGEVMSNSGMTMHDMMDDMMASLKGKTGDAFDQAFLSEMIVHHQGAVVMAEAALKDAKHQEIKDLAKAIIAAQNKEIADMKLWQKTWFNN